jgi:hypothetical protein
MYSYPELVATFNDFSDEYSNYEVIFTLDDITDDNDYIYTMRLKGLNSFYLTFSIHRYCNNHTEDFRGNPCDNKYEKRTYLFISADLSGLDFNDKECLEEALRSPEVFDYYYSIFYIDWLNDANDLENADCKHCDDNPYDADPYADCLPDYMYG